jgi:uncharacterized protein (DUF1330 family)
VAHSVSLESRERQCTWPTVLSVVPTTHRAVLQDGPRLYETFREKKDGCIKVVLRFTIRIQNVVSWMRHGLGGVMRDSRFKSSAILLFAEIRPHSGTVCLPKRRWTIRTTITAAAICTLLVCFARGTPVMARGGHGGGLGMHGGRMGDSGLLTPIYVLIVVSKITDAVVFKATMSGLTTPSAAFVGHLAVDEDKSAAWEGTASEHIVMIQFDNPDAAQAWKSSDAFKSFDADLHRSSESSMQLLQGLPMPIARGLGGDRRGRGFDQKAFEPNVKDYDQMLNNKLHSICKGC